MFVRFYKAVAKSAVVNVPKALLDCLPMGGAAFDFARDVARHWKEAAPEAEERRAEVAALAVATPQALRQQAEQAVAEVAADQPEPLRLALVSYLTHLPGTVRRSLSRPADLTGKTTPANMSLDDAKDVLPLLPARPPHKGLHAGKRFGDWELAELVGVGGFGEVWKATNPHLPPAAFKFCTDPAAAKALRNDAALLGLVMRKGRHPGIVSLEDTNLTHDPPYLRFEYVAGGDLAGLIRDWARLEPAKRAGRALKVMRRLAEIVGFAHRLGIVHRDLKPANILLQRGGSAYELRVADFGIGGVAAGKSILDTRQGTTPGDFLTSAVRGACTPLYASPQQRRGESPDPRDDVYSLGVIWCQLLLTDVQAEVAADWREELADCGAPAAVLGVIGRCLASKPEKRFGDAEELAGMIRRLGHPHAPGSPAQTAEPIRPAQQPDADDIAEQFPQPSRVIQEAHQAARHAAAAFDYAGAALCLESLPEHQRNAAFHAEVRRKRDRLAALRYEIRAAAQARRFDHRLRQQILELRDLNPDDDLVRLLDLTATAPESRDVPTLVLPGGEVMKFAAVPGGTFWMGGGGGEAGDRQVTIAAPYAIGVYPVTQGQWRAVMGNNPSYFSRVGAGSRKVKGISDDDLDVFPVEQVSWDDVQAFLKKLNKLGRESGFLYRLPTEAEWEYACRGAAHSLADCSYHYYFQQPTNDLSPHWANFDGNHPFGNAKKGPCLGRTRKVGSYQGNRLGIHDMHGNVWEWTQDLHEGGSDRIFRGGGWFNRAEKCQAAYRGWNAPDSKHNSVGFRLLQALMSSGPALPADEPPLVC